MHTLLFASCLSFQLCAHVNSQPVPIGILALPRVANSAFSVLDSSLRHPTYQLPLNDQMIYTLKFSITSPTRHIKAKTSMKEKKLYANHSPRQMNSLVSG